jgi:hypothetical protein
MMSMLGWRVLGISSHPGPRLHRKAGVWSCASDRAHSPRERLGVSAVWRDCWRHRVPATLTFIGLISWSWAACGELADLDRPRLMVGIGGQGRTFETMGYSDSRPTTNGEVGGRVEVGCRIAGPWWGNASGHIGGSWFDFLGPATSGKIEQATWTARGGIEREMVVGKSSSGWLGIGAEYSESRSWLQSQPLDSGPISDQGPRAYLGGGYVMAGASTPIGGGCWVHGEFVQSAYHAHARLSRVRTDFNWLGQSFEVAIGLQWFFGRGQRARPAGPGE